MASRGLTVVDRIGQRVGKLVVVSKAPSRVDGNAVRARWVCRCDCGKKVVVTGQNLSRASSGNGGTRSCGCLMGKKIKHGMVDTSIYRVWHMMLQRCTNPRNSAYRSYGGRGIRVCDEWKDFQKFYADMGDRPSNRSLDRIDNEKGYFLGNCRWATKMEQGNNRRTNRFIELNGTTMTLSEWSRFFGLTTHAIRARLNSGWTVEMALTTPIKKKTKKEI